LSVKISLGQSQFIVQSDKDYLGHAIHADWNQVVLRDFVFSLKLKLLRSQQTRCRSSTALTINPSS